MTQLAKGLDLDLTDPFAGHIEFAADFLQGAGTPVVDAEAQSQHPVFARGQVVHQFQQVVAEQGLGCEIDRGDGIVILDEIAQRTVRLWSAIARVIAWRIHQVA